jgi:hypothetical protein
MIKTALLLTLTICLAGLIVMPKVHADSPKPVVLSDMTMASTLPEPVAPAQEDAPAFNQATVDYLLGVMSDWPPALQTLPSVPYRDVAESIATVTSDPSDAVLLAALGYFEGSRYAQYVDDGSCNDAKWVKSPEGARLTHWGTCDHRVARSIWQIHPQDDRASLTHGLCSTEAISTRVGAARCALDIAHRSLAATGTLSYYTGEWDGPHPKADERLSFAKRALKKHPPPKVAPGTNTP